ncbi:MAG: PIN domain-containing protein [Gemmatimonadota bacterium]
MGLLIDSTALIHAERKRQAPADFVAELMERWHDPELGVSVMSAAELFHGCWRADTPARRARREEFVEAILAVIPVASITLAVARLFGQIDARLSGEGRRIPTSDLLIASTALTRGDAIVTGNERHFNRVPGLEVHALS